MTDVVETWRKCAIVNGLKVITIKTNADCASGHLIDLNSDVTDGRAMAMEEICNTILQDDVGADKTGTWDPDTGIYTMGTITTGIHCITFIGV